MLDDHFDNVFLKIDCFLITEYYISISLINSEFAPLIDVIIKIFNLVQFAFLIEVDLLIKVMMKIILLVEFITDASDEFVCGIILIRL